MKLYVARHTQAEHNERGVLNGDSTVAIHLTNHGLAQADQLGNKLAGESFEVVYVSQMARAQQTAEAVNAHHNAPVVVDARLNDVDTGFEGRPMQEFLDAFHASADPWHARFHGGESIADVKVRVSAFLEELRNTHHESVLIVSHGTVLECIYGIIADVSFEEASSFQPAQGDFAILDF